MDENSKMDESPELDKYPKNLEMHQHPKVDFQKSTNKFIYGLKSIAYPSV